MITGVFVFAVLRAKRKRSLVTALVGSDFLRRINRLFDNKIELLILKARRLLVYLSEEQTMGRIAADCGDYIKPMYIVKAAKILNN